MTKTEALENIAYARSLAEHGAKTPLLGSSISLMWGMLVIPTLIFHGLALLGKFPISSQNIGIIWAIYGIIGFLGSAYLGRKIDKQAGAKSHINQVGEALGVSLGILLAAYAITTVFVVVAKGMPEFLFNTIIVFAFGLVTMNHAVLAKITNQAYIRLAAILAGAMTVLSYIFVQSPTIYFLAAFGILVTQIIPSLIGLKKEARND